MFCTNIRHRFRRPSPVPPHPEITLRTLSYTLSLSRYSSLSAQATYQTQAPPSPRTSQRRHRGLGDSYCGSSRPACEVFQARSMITLLSGTNIYLERGRVLLVCCHLHAASTPRSCDGTPHGNWTLNTGRSRCLHGSLLRCKARGRIRTRTHGFSSPRRLRSRRIAGGRTRIWTLSLRRR